MSDKTELARRVLKTLAQGDVVSTDDALQLRNWAMSSEDSVLTLEAIAHRILAHAKDPKPSTGGNAPQARKPSMKSSSKTSGV